jgi:hypothetical protein
LPDPVPDPDGDWPAVGECAAGIWQLLHATVPFADNRPSKNGF